MTSVWHVFVIRVKDRESLQRFLQQHGVATLIHYPIPPHLQAAYKDLGFGRGDFPLSEKMHDEVLSLPMGPHLTDADVTRVVEAIRAWKP